MENKRKERFLLMKSRKKIIAPLFQENSLSTVILAERIGIAPALL